MPAGSFHTFFLWTVCIKYRPWSSSEACVASPWRPIRGTTAVFARKERVSICGSLTNVKVGLVSLLAYFAKQHKVDGTRGGSINKMTDECWISTIIFILETPCIGPHCKHHIVCMSGQKTCHAFKKRRHVRTIGCCRMLFYLLCFQNENRKAH